MRKKRLRLVVPVALAAALCVPNAAHGQDTDSKLSVHGYLTQAYAKSDGLTFAGIPKDGTWDYLVAALQMRYAITGNDHIVLQARTRRIGTSPLSDNSITLDWAYYAHTFGAFETKIGKVPGPRGLYNEIRSVGTVLPFFRAPTTFYREGPETIKGASVGVHIPMGSWRLESVAYAGNVDLVLPVFLPTGPILFTTSLAGNYGGDLWLHTPVPGLRVGASAIRLRLPTAVGDTVGNTSWAASVDGTFDHFFVRAEYTKLALKKVLPGGGNQTQTIAYGQGGLKFTDHVSLNLQWEFANYAEPGRSYHFTDDRAIGVNYAVSPNIVFKIEGHAIKGYNFDQFLLTTAPAPKAKYGIASLSVSF